MRTIINLLKKHKISGLIAFIKIKIGRTKSIKLSTIKHRIELRPFTSDVTTFKHIFVYGDYDFNAVPEPKVIIDAGANVGLASVYFANKYPMAKIIAIELAPSNYQLLTKNVCRYPQIKTHNAGIWHKKEILKFKEEGISPWGYKVENQIQRDGISVLSITLNEIIDTYEIQIIDILKIDIEGAEVELFSENYEHWLPKVRYLVIETHDRWRAGSTDVVRAALSKFDFTDLGRVGENLIFKNNNYR